MLPFFLKIWYSINRGGIMSKHKLDIDGIILDYIIENKLLYDFDKLKVFDIYTYKRSSGKYPLKTDLYGWKRLYKFNIGNFDQDIYVNFGDYATMDDSLKKSVNKIEYKDTKTIINFLKSDIYKNSNIIPFLANLLKLDIEEIIKKYNEKAIKKETKIIEEKISGIDKEITRLLKEKEVLQKKVQSFSNNDSEPLEYVDINELRFDKFPLI